MSRNIWAGMVLVAAALPAWAAGGADAQAVRVKEGAQPEYALPGVAAAAPGAAEAELNCAYQPAAQAGEKRFRFADGNTAVFSAKGIRFESQQGSAVAVAEAAQQSWWCQADGLVVFTPQTAGAEKGGAVKVEFFGSTGARITETLVSAPPHAADVSWTYEQARQAGDCLGMTFRVQPGKKPAHYMEYKLCPSGV